jgi:dTDP-4-amino-4,6-dideoxygalactose transaminase
VPPMQHNSPQLIPEYHDARDPTQFGIRVPFVRPSMPRAAAVEADFAAIIASGRLTKGPYVDRFEQAIAKRIGVRHAVAVSSCTVGLMLVYRALDLSAGGCRSRRAAPDSCPVGCMELLSRFGMGKTVNRIEPLGEVILPSFTFLAAPAAIVWNNLRPVFVDVDPITTNVTAQAVRAAITPRTVAISACHNFGNPCDIPGLEAIAAEYNLPLVIDAAHGFGASFHGRPVGAGATTQVFSLSPTKLLVAGEGGIVATDCDCLGSMATTAPTTHCLRVSTAGCPNSARPWGWHRWRSSTRWPPGEMLWPRNTAAICQTYQALGLWSNSQGQYRATRISRSQSIPRNSG